MSDKTEQEILVLQGGGALGAYQAGAFEAIVEAGHTPTWIAGISIGAINAAIIAGNRPEHRIEKLSGFWSMVSSQILGRPLFPGKDARTLFNESSSVFASYFGVPGFFSPRIPSPLASIPGTPAALSFYDTRQLEETLEQYVDFDYLNDGPIRLSVGAVNVRTGNFAYFDTKKCTLTPRHIMASGALPPGLGPIEIDGEYYWDGGLVSNTPLQYVLEQHDHRRDLCIFQVDLFCARGDLPNTIFDVADREKDIRYSSRTRLNTDVVRKTQHVRAAAKRLYEKLPASLKSDPDAKLLQSFGTSSGVTIVHLIYRKAGYESESKDYDFSRISVEEHSRSGRADVERTFASTSWKNRDVPVSGVKIFDLGHDPATNH